MQVYLRKPYAVDGRLAQHLGAQSYSSINACHQNVAPSRISASYLTLPRISRSTPASNKVRVGPVRVLEYVIACRRSLLS